MDEQALRPLKKLKRLAITKDYFREPIEIINLQTGVPINATTVPNYWTLVAQDADPASGVWKQGTWETTSTGVYLARVMLGPPDGDFILARGSVSDLYLRLKDDPEAPVSGPWRFTAT